MQFQLSCAAIVATLAAPAAAQQAASPGTIPIYDITPQVAPTPTPTPAPTPSASPTPRSTPTPRATPVAQASPVAPRATPRPTPTPAPRATQPAASAPAPVAPTVPAPQATYVGPQVLPAPVATATPEAVATPDAVPAPVATAEVSAGASDGAMPWWLWFLAGIVVATGAALLIGRLRRKPAEPIEDVAPVVPEPPAPPVLATPPAPPRPVVAPTPPAPVAPTPGPFLEFQLAPLRVGMEGERLRLDFDLTVGNPASMSVAEVSIATLLLTAHAGQDDTIAAFHADDAKRGLDPFPLGAGERRHLEATTALPREALNIVIANNRSFYVPILAIDARYRWEDGRESRTTAAFMVGPAAPQGKLAPIFTDRGDRMVDRLEVRLHGQVRRS
ncbi:hypothetical protein DMC47_21050 [Nostoc sp. 3335mG]|nr:hypothetical protein DMC47_21050 [Nostoc sp. 3335mG]